jgi:hypothetical protein
VWINQGDIILIGLRDYEKDKGDIILKYNSDEARNLKSYGELPENGGCVCVCVSVSVSVCVCVSFVSFVHLCGFYARPKAMDMNSIPIDIYFDVKNRLIDVKNGLIDVFPFDPQPRSTRR